MWYWPVKEERTDQPMAAIVTYVWNDYLIDLTVFTSSMPIPVQSVPIVQDGSPYTVNDSPYVEWMPYQIGQAKKNEKTK